MIFPTRKEDTKMASKKISEQLTFLISAITKNWEYPSDMELPSAERKELVAQLKKLNQHKENLDKVVNIIDTFYKDKVNRRLKAFDSSLSWIFIILQHELVSATRLHALLLDLAHEEHFSSRGIKKINQYFAETGDHGDNNNFITMSSSDMIDSLDRAKVFHIYPSSDDNEELENESRPMSAKSQSTNRKKEDNNIIKLKHC